MASCTSDIIHQDDNICILNPKLKRGIELVHTVGYMIPINGINFEDMMNIIGKTGLKSSGQLIREKGGILPKTLNEAIDSENKNVSRRRAYMEYDPDQFDRIFFRPPASAPYKLEDGKLISAGNWRDFVDHPREGRLFFGGESYSDIANVAANIADVGQGIVSIRVDPDKTYVFYEGMKNIINLNKNTGMRTPPSLLTLEKKRERYQQSRILLSTFLDMLEKTPGRVEHKYEVIATIPNIPACAFDKVIKQGDTSYDTPKLPEDILIQKQAAEFNKNKREKADEMHLAIQDLLKPIFEKERELNAAARELRVQMDSKIKTVSLKKSRIEAAVETLKLKLSSMKEEFTKVKEAARARAKNWHPLQKIHITDKLSQIIELFNEKKERIKEAEAQIKSMSGGTRRQKRSKRYTYKH